MSLKSVLDKKWWLPFALAIRPSVRMHILKLRLKKREWERESEKQLDTRGRLCFGAS